MSTLSPNLGLQYIVEKQAGAEAVLNSRVINYADSLINCAVKDRDLATPPGSPAEGDRYLVAASPTGAWGGLAGKIVAYYNGWRSFTPKEGWRMWVDDENKLLIYDGAAWVQNYPGVTAASTVVSAVAHGITPAVGSSADYARADHTHGTPHQNARRTYNYQSNFGATTWNTLGSSAITLFGTQTNSDDTDAPFVQYATGAVINTVAGVSTPSHFRRNWLADVLFLAKTGSVITSVRYFTGFVDPTVSLTSDGPNGDYALFRYSTAADGTAFWRILTGAGGAPTVFTTTVAIAVSTLYLFRVRLLASSVEFWINGVLAHTATATLPTATVAMNGTSQLENLVAADRTHKVSRVSVNQA